MPKLFAKQADLGVLHLETMCVGGAWRWWVLNMTDRVHLGRGTSLSLGDAMLAAERITGGTPDWRDIGPEVTDDKALLYPRDRAFRKGVPVRRVEKTPLTM
jgi:hypothetical protein